MLSEKKIAEKILKDTQKIYVENHEYRIIDCKDFSHLDLKFYDDSMQNLETFSFKHVADVENITIKNSFMNPQTFLRLSLSFDGTITSVFYQLKPKIWFRILFWLMRTKLTNTVDFETEFENGHFITTSNAKMAMLLDSPPQIFAEFLPPETSIENLLAKHRQRIEEYAEQTEVSPVQLYSLPDILESQHRMEKIKSEFRKRVGWLKKAEWDRLAENPNETTDEIYKEFKEIQSR